MSQPMPSVKDLVERNKDLAKTHKPFSYFSERAAIGLGLPRTLILTCVDPRCTPEHFLGLQGLEAVVIRNVCGHVSPNLNDIIGLDGFINFDELMIVHHTDCGALHFTNAQWQELVKQRAPATENIESMSFGAITNVEQSIKDDLAALKGCPLIRKELADNTHGFVYDIKTGLLTTVVE